ncbi:MAG: glutamine synthetase family protein [Gammaproteobacteria bacterium]|nr:glutamine synthetase family protein [Gammaproteobacteria bacterium]
MKAAVVDQNGNWRGKRVPVEQLEKVLDGQMRLPVSICNLDIWGADIAGSPLVFASGDGDGQCRWTGRGPLPMPWTKHPSALIPLTLHTDSGTPFPGDPRQVLANVLSRYRKSGLTPVVAFELEFYLTRMIDGQLSAPRFASTNTVFADESIYSLQELDEIDDLLQAVNHACAEQDIPLDTALGESGAGQFELNLKHGSDPMKAADDAILLKRVIQGVARQFGSIATFMAKPYADCAGSGMHVHFSLLDAAGRNIFNNDSDEGSPELQHAVAGLLDSLIPCAAIFAPNLNSYRRLQPETHAPTQVTWGYENRTTALRIPGGQPASRRIEHRVAGADANPYLVLAAILGAALLGMEKKSTPQAAQTGNGYEATTASLPTDWQSALDLLEQSQVVETIFPPEFLPLFLATKRQELKRLSQHMSAFELATYLETC